MDESLGQIPAYQSDVFGFYSHETVANEFAQARGSYNVPYGALLEKPAPAPEGCCNFKVGMSWAVVEDHRNDKLCRADTGEEYVLGRTVVVDGVGVCYVGAGPIPVWLVTQELNQVQAPETPLIG
ncbi:phage tail protein [Herbaspirillum sp.]|uniref:phage tail protein n=1 Tax=Herbaspirillum sp. TaxID=1890675 RepID=UPI001B22A7A1|nr:phage tail protein [Herbaspirillum sp.]MBO9538774.1 phage tail protein [Herbaspirillum sp.]